MLLAQRRLLLYLVVQVGDAGERQLCGVEGVELRERLVEGEGVYLHEEEAII